MRAVVVCLVTAVLAVGCSSPAPSPTTAPAKPAGTTPAAASPAASPGAAPAASPAASPASASSQAAPAKPAEAAAPKPIAKLPDFPTKAIEVIIPYPAGGGFDAVARQLAVPMQKELGQPVVVKNVPGGNQRIGARQFEQAGADGYTLMFVGDTGVYVSTLVEPAEGFDILSWQWVTGIRQLIPYVAVGKDSPIKTIQDLLAADKNGQKLRIGNNGIGGFLPTNAVFSKSIGLQNVVHVGGFGGTADLTPSLVRGDLDFMVYQPISSTNQFVTSGDVRPLLVLKPTRDKLLPDTPTAREAGVPGVDDLEAMGGQTIGFAVVKGTAPERRLMLEQATINALKDADFLKWARETGVDQDLLGLTGEEMAKGKEREYSVFRKNAEVLRQIVAGS